MHPNMQEQLRKAAQAEQERQAKKLIDLMVDVQARLFDKAAAYNNLVVSLGFAGFLTIWVWSRDILHPWDSNLVLLLLGSSLFLFILWNVISSFLISRQNIKLGKIVSSNLPAATKIERIEVAEAEIRKWSLKYYAAWYFVFVLAATSGFIAGLLLLLVIGLRMANDDLSIYSLVSWLLNLFDAN